MLKKTKKSLTFKRLSEEKEQELVQGTKELETLYGIGALINQNLGDLDAILPIILEKVVSLTGYEMGAIFLLNESGDILEIKSQIGLSPALLQEVKVVEFSEGISRKAIRLRQPVIVSISDYPSTRIAPILREEKVQAAVGIPLLAKGKAIGTIIFSTRSPRKISQSEVNSLESIGNYIGIALENAKLFSTVAKAKAEWETTFDAVTDLITILDKDYRIIRANEATFTRSGLKPEEMLGKKCFEILYHRDQPCEGCYVSETIKTKKHVSGERNSQYLNGVFQHGTFPVYDEEGEVIAVVDLAREITKEKRMQMEKEVVNYVNKTLVSSLDVKQGIQSVYAELKKVLDCERMTVALFDEEGEGFRYFALEKDYDAGELVEDVLYPWGGTHFERIAETGLPEIINNAEGGAWIGQKLLQEEGIRSTLIFPLEYKGKIIGTVNFGSSKPNHFSEAQFNLLRQIAPGLAIFIQNILLFRETKKRLEELTILHEITKISNSASLSIDQMLNEIVDNRDLFKSEYLDIFLIEENTKRLIHYTYDKSHRHNIDNIEALGLCLGKGITGWVAEKGEPLLVNDVTKDPRYVAGDESIRSEICVPLKVGQKVIGVIDAQSRELDAFSQNDLRWLNIAAGQIASLIENNRLQEEIKKSEEKYRTVVESAIDGVCVIGKDHLFKYVNERLAEIQGYRREQLIGTDIRNFLDEESRALLADREDKRARGIKLSPHFELNFLHKDGGVRNAEISASAIKDSKGDINIVVFVKDITERKQAEEALRQSEEEARRLSQENATVAEIGRIISSTLNIEEVYERFIEEVRKLIPFDRIAVTLINREKNIVTIAYSSGGHIKAREVGDEFPLAGTAVERVMRTHSGLLIQAESEADVARIPGLLKVFQAGYRSMIVGPLISKDIVIGALFLGSARPNSYADYDLKLLESIGNQIAGAIANAQLFMESKQAEEKYRAIIRTAMDGFWIVDMEGHFWDVNDAYCRLIGYSRDELLTMRISDVEAEERPEDTARRIQKIMEVGGDRFETRHKCKDGRIINIEISVNYMEVSGGRMFVFLRDITERKRTEVALRQSEEKYRTILETMQDAYYEVDLAGNYTFVNDALCINFGYTKEELIGTKSLQRQDEANAKKTYDSFKEIYRTGEPVKALEVEYSQKGGTKGTYELSASLIRDAQGKPIGLRGISRDITERKRAEEALRESENKFRSLVENSIVGVYLIQEGIFKYVNARFAEIHGYEIEEMVGKMSPKQTIFPEDLSIVVGNIDKRMRGKEESIHYEFRIVTKSQEIRHGEVFGSRTIYQGKPAVIGTMLDITDRKKAEEALRQSEERYRNILESIEDGYYEVDLTGDFTFFNDSMCRIYGYSREEFMDISYRQYTDQETAKKVFQAYNRVYRTGKPDRGFAHEIIRKDGTKRYVETSISLLKDPSGKPTGFRGISWDVTEKKKLEEQLFQTEKLRAVGEMASGVAHDFNNALAAILGNTQLLLHTAQDEELRETLKIIEKVAKDSSQTVRRLQDFTRKGVDQELFKVDVNAVIRDSMEMTKPKWKDEPQSRGVRIEMVSNLEEIPSVSGNASELREVVTNMIFNAIEAMPEGGKVEIRTYKEGRHVLIQISDSGIGISEETKKRIFEPFFTTKPFTNTGLGLSMSYGIIKRFGGKIEIESKLGQGTTFTIILPIGGEETEEAVSPQAIKKARQALILVIDDDEFVRSVLSRTLAQANHQVTLAENGEQGVKIFKEGKFDIVLTDLGLPGISGWEVCRMIKEISPQTPVGMITGWGVEKNRSEVEEYGLDFFISKPFDFNQILNVVAETMASKGE
jgi:PAS domain S-box-containing protein